MSISRTLLDFVLKDDLLGWERKIEMLLFAAISPTINNLESPSFQSPIVS